MLGILSIFEEGAKTSGKSVPTPPSLVPKKKKTLGFTTPTTTPPATTRRRDLTLSIPSVQQPAGLGSHLSSTPEHNEVTVARARSRSDPHII